MDTGRLNAVMVAIGDLADNGIPWRCRNHAERDALADLMWRCMIEIGGRTQGQTVKLLPAGVMAAWQRWSIEPGDVLALMERVRQAKTIKTPWGADVVMGFRLVKSAGDWWSRASKTDAAWRQYQEDLEVLTATLLPALTLGWLRLYVAAGQLVWAVMATEREPVSPSTVPEVCMDKTAWDEAFDKAVDTFTMHPPDSGNRLARRLPASQWA